MGRPSPPALEGAVAAARCEGDLRFPVSPFAAGAGHGQERHEPPPARVHGDVQHEAGPETQMETCRWPTGGAPQTGTPAAFPCARARAAAPRVAGRGLRLAAWDSVPLPGGLGAVTVSHLPRALHSHAHVVRTASLFPSVWTEDSL